MPQYTVVIIILLLAMGASIATRKLTLLAAVTGGVVGFFIYAGAGYTGLILLAAFFALGVLATSWRFDLKQSQHLAERDKGRRKPGQVLANGGIAALAGLAIWIYPHLAPLLRLAIAGSLSAATADTVSSELGMVYGRRFYNIKTFRPDRKGLDGVVSLEGSLFGLGGSILIAVIYAFGFGWNADFFKVIIAGTAGNLVDSYLGATLERKNLVGNNMVNFLNTLTGALAAIAMGIL